MTTLKTTTFGNHKKVIITAGATVKCGDGQHKQICGVFLTEEDARSQDADSLSIAVPAFEDLTAEQQATAIENSNSL